MYGKVVNVTCPSSGIHTFVLKWYMTRFPDGIPLQYYPPTINIPPSNAKKFLLQTDINKSITVGYKFSSRQLSTSTSTHGWKMMQNRQHQQYEAPGDPLVEVIHRPSRREIIDLDE